MRFWFSNGAWASKQAQQRIRKLEPEQVKSIAVIRHAALGDMILTRPFLYECRQFFPNAKITLSVVSNYTRGTPTDMVDRVHTAIGSDQRTVPKRQQLKVAKELGYHDLLFDLAATSRSFLITKMNPALLKFGFPYHCWQKQFFYDVAVPRSDMHFEAEAMLDLLNIIGHRTSMPLVFDLPGEREKPAREYVVYFTSASTDYKCWPDDRFTGLIDRMSGQYPDMDHLVLKGVGDEESIDAILRPLTSKTNVAARQIDNVDDTIAFIRNASLVISNDTGVRHLAIASGTASVGIFSFDDRYNSSPFRYWPRFDRHEIALRADATWPQVEEVNELAVKLLSNAP